MDVPPETDSYIKQSIDFSLGLPVSTTALEAKLRVSEESHRRIHQQYLHLLARFNAKDQQIERIRVCYLTLPPFTHTPLIHFIEFCEYWYIGVFE